MLQKGIMMAKPSINYMYKVHEFDSIVDSTVI